MGLGFGSGSILFNFFHKSIMSLGYKYNPSTGQWVEEDLPGSGFEDSVSGSQVGLGSTTMFTVPAKKQAVVTSFRSEKSGGAGATNIEYGSGPTITPLFLGPAGTLQMTGGLDNPAFVFPAGDVKITNVAADTTSYFVTYKLIDSAP